jgi:hypothetical protein
MSTSVSQFTTRIVQGYISAFKSIARVIAFSLGVAAISALITLPLWYWATTHRSSFTTAVLILLAGVMLFFAGKQLGSHINNLKTKGYSTLKIALFPLKHITKILTAFLLVYITLITFAAVSTAAGVVSAVVSIALIGILFFASR